MINNIDFKYFIKISKLKYNIITKKYFTRDILYQDKKLVRFKCKYDFMNIKILENRFKLLHRHNVIYDNKFVKLYIEKLDEPDDDLSLSIIQNIMSTSYMMDLTEIKYSYDIKTNKIDSYHNLMFENNIVNWNCLICNDNIEIHNSTHIFTELMCDECKNNDYTLNKDILKKYIEWFKFNINYWNSELHKTRINSILYKRINYILKKIDNKIFKKERKPRIVNPNKPTKPKKPYVKKILTEEQKIRVRELNRIAQKKFRDSGKYAEYMKTEERKKAWNEYRRKKRLEEKNKKNDL
jgi:hypothetical protein